MHARTFRYRITFLRLRLHFSSLFFLPKIVPKLSSLYHRIVLVVLKPSMPRRPRSLSRIIKATGGQTRVLEAGIGVRAGAKQGSLCLSFICPFLHTRCPSQSMEVALAGADSWSDSGFLREAAGRPEESVVAVRQAGQVALLK